MKKQIITTLFAISAMAVATAQTTCTSPTKQAELNANQVRARILNGGDNFWDFADGRYQVPYEEGVPTPTTIFAHSLWIGGFDAGGNLHTAGQTYRQNGNDFWSGGLDDNGQTVNEDCANWDKIWIVKKTDIELAQSLFAAGQLSLSNCPASLLEWPAKDNPHSLSVNGFPINTSLPAPYFDADGDGVYDPLMGDYPVLQTSPNIVIPDEMTFSLNNDKGNIHTETDGAALGIQFQKINYAFDSPTSPINRTTFARYVIQNKSNKVYNAVKIGLWTDFDLGCHLDDYVGSSVPNNAIYVYNSDNDDSTCEGVLGYGINPPVQAVQLLNRTMTNSMFYYNNISPLPPPYLSNPQIATEYYDYLNSKWLDAIPLTQGGNGYGGTVSTNYAFTGNPNNSNEWSMTSVAMPLGDYRILATTTEDEFVPNEIVTVDVAYSFHRGENRTNLENVNLMEQELPIVRDFYAQTLVSTTDKPSKTNLAVALYPNPTSGNVILNIDNPITDVELTLYNPSGARISQQTVKAGTSTVPIILPNVSGMYILQGISTDGKIFAKKIIKQ